MNSVRRTSTLPQLYSVLFWPRLAADSWGCCVGQSLGVHITLRMRLECTILRAGKRDQGEPVEVLNEVVVDRGSGPYLTKIECWERDHLITKVGQRLSLVMLAWCSQSVLLNLACCSSSAFKTG